MHDSKNVYCVKCGQEGFKLVSVNRDNITITALQCDSCGAILYDHSAMVKIQKTKNL